MTVLGAMAVALGLVALALADLRWWRVAQREHYLAGSATRFAIRWWRSSTTAIVAILAGVLGLSVALVGDDPVREAGAMLASLVAAAGPPGLGVRGRTSPLRWTARSRRLAVLTVALEAAAIAVGMQVVGLAPALAVAALLSPLAVDAAAAIASPLERRLGEAWVEKARRRLTAVGPRIVAITGSYGKTTTKEYVRHLLAASTSVVASPASFNNRMGLARAINEHLLPGTEVFVAEMGTYGPGEIADLVAWIEPEVAAITAIGPVHLERFGSEDAIVVAKSEILEPARVAVLNVDDPRLAALADEQRRRREVVAVGSDPSADVVVRRDGEDTVVLMAGEEVARTDAPGVFPTNLGIAVAIVRALGYEIDPRAVETLPTPRHRRSVYQSERGFLVIDDTFNANPEGARAALDLLVRTGGPDARRVVVTPGMIELGPRASAENEAFARAAAEVVDDLLIVGRTNARALARGAAGGRARIVRMPDRAAAVEWVRRELRPGDVVLYENDLPDHYP